MDGLRNYHTKVKLSLTEKDKYSLITLMWNLKISMSDSIYQIDSHGKQTHGYQGRNGGE